MKFFLTLCLLFLTVIAKDYFTLYNGFDFPKFITLVDQNTRCDAEEGGKIYSRNWGFETIIAYGVIYKCGENEYFYKFLNNWRYTKLVGFAAIYFVKNKKNPDGTNYLSPEDIKWVEKLVNSIPNTESKSDIFIHYKDDVTGVYLNNKFLAEVKSPKESFFKVEQGFKSSNFNQLMNKYQINNG